MNLLLTSDGIVGPEIKKCFADKIKNLSNKTAAVLYTIKNPGDEEWLKYPKQELDEFGFSYDLINLSEDRPSLIDLSSYGVIYMCGGNTFYILDRLRKTHLNIPVREAIEKNILYVGVSAGSIMMGPDIEIAGFGPAGDVNDIGLQNLSGFNLIPFSIYPHYKESEKEWIEKFFTETKKPVITLNDSQAIIVEDNTYTLIGGNDGLQLGYTLP